MKRFTRAQKLDSRHLAAGLVGAFAFSGAAIGTHGRLGGILFAYLLGFLIMGFVGLLAVGDWTDEKRPPTFGAALITAVATIPLILGVVVRLHG